MEGWRISWGWHFPFWLNSGPYLVDSWWGGGSYISQYWTVSKASSVQSPVQCNLATQAQVSRRNISKNGGSKMRHREGRNLCWRGPNSSFWWMSLWMRKFCAQFVPLTIWQASYLANKSRMHLVECRNDAGDTQQFFSFLSQTVGKLTKMDTSHKCPFQTRTTALRNKTARKEHEWQTDRKFWQTPIERRCRNMHSSFFCCWEVEMEEFLLWVQNDFK